MPPRIQNSKVIDQLHDPLRLSEIPLETPALGAELVPVYPLALAELAADQRQAYTSNQSINGAAANFSDVEAGLASPGVMSYFGETPTSDDARLWSFLNISVWGGTVNPVTVEVQYRLIGTAGIPMWSGTVANPGEFNLSEIGFPIAIRRPNVALHIQIGAGGAGDWAVAHGVCYVIDQGVPLPYP